jgi:hypothetical protein
MIIKEIDLKRIGAMNKTLREKESVSVPLRV